MPKMLGANAPLALLWTSMSVSALSRVTVTHINEAYNMGYVYMGYPR